jgi:predicted permease
MTMTVLGLVGVALGATLGVCLIAPLFSRRSNGPAIAVCLVAGIFIPPAVIGSVFWALGSIHGTHNSPLWFLVGWILCISMAGAFANAYAKQEPPEKPSGDLNEQT